MMMAPAVRVAERSEVYSAVSVATGTAKAINGTSATGRTATQIDFFDRVGDLTNGLGNENRPHLSPLLKSGSEAEIVADGITHPEVIEKFKKSGYSFTQDGTPEQILQEKAAAKEAFQKNFGMEVDSDKPLFVSFARMVHQKGMEFVSTNVEHVLNTGGQIVVGGPVGDAVGAAERELFLKLKAKLVASKNPNAKNFVFIDGPVKGRVKGLSLAGGDFFLLPSRYEPCGLTDCEALFNGTIPIAHHTGGLDKGKATILYRPRSPDDQGWQLGEAINQAFEKYSDRAAFQHSQVEAMKQDFSIEKNFSKFLSNQRTEVYGKMLRELDRLVAKRKLTSNQAHQLIKERMINAHPNDMDNLIDALKMIHPSRRSSMMNWMIQNGP
jgi:glycosyltransferase involved in cell wall biosynthesis